MSYQVDVTVVGAGVVGLACARKLAQAGLWSPLFSKRKRGLAKGLVPAIAKIHAGLYYDLASLKAPLCRLGRDKLYDYCRQRQIDYCQTGKWVVATQDIQLDKLSALHANALRNGVDDVTIISAAEARAI